MSLRFRDAVRLSYANVTGHKSRSRLVITILVISFCLPFIANVAYRGLESSVLNASVTDTDGAAYIQTGFTQDYYYHKEYGKVVPRHPLDRPEEIVAKRIEQYGGQIIGEVSDVRAWREWKFNVISESAVTHFLTSKNSDNRAGVAAIGSCGMADEVSLEFRMVALYPCTIYGNLRTTNMLFGPVLERVAPSPREVFVVDDGSEAFLKYISQENEFWRETQGYDYDPSPAKLMVAKFSNLGDLVKYYSNVVLDGAKYGYDLSSGYRYEVKDLFNNTVSVIASFTFYQMLLFILSVIFMIFAIWVSVLTFSHVADEDVAAVALYRSMGASTFDIYIIYGMYLVELCLIALLICACLVLISCGLVTVFSAQELANTLKEFYQLTNAPAVSFFGFDSATVVLALMMLVAAPLTLLFTCRRFSAKYVAQKLKER